MNSNKSIIQVTAAVICVNAKILAARRGANKHLAGYWEFPGGKIESGETQQQCLARELKEELSINAVIGKHLTSSDYHYPTQSIRLHCYWVHSFDGQIKLIDHDRYRWLLVDELDGVQWSPADIPIVEKLKWQLSK